MDSIYLAQFATIAIVHFLAVASPGPDFLIVTKNSLTSGRKSGIFTAMGVALGIGVHVTYCILGIGLIISQSILLFNIIKWVGAAYLIWIGIKSLRSKKKFPSPDDEAASSQKISTLSSFKSFVSGFLVNVLNPKATLFFLAVFTQVIDATTPKFIQTLYGLEMILATFIWFSIVSVAFSNPLMKKKISNFEHWIDRVSGAVLVLLGIKVALAANEK